MEDTEKFGVTLGRWVRQRREGLGMTAEQVWNRMEMPSGVSTGHRMLKRSYAAVMDRGGSLLIQAVPATDRTGMPSCKSAAAEAAGVAIPGTPTFVRKR